MRSFWIKRGFTLIELMLVVAIIGLLSAIAIPKFANLVIKSKEAAIRGTLGALRSALSIYYADTEGALYPNDLTCLTVNRRYLNELPVIQMPSYVSVPHPTYFHQLTPGIDDSVYELSGVPYGSANAFSIDYLRLNCTHTDTGGRVWSSW